MIRIRKHDERGHANTGWLDTYHTFSFNSYYDPAHMEFRALRVMNDDRIEAGRGFGTHPHNDMEIVTYVLEGALEHRDSMGHTERLRRGEVQQMTAGTGITHSEHAAPDEGQVHLYQIWLVPDRAGHEPSYDQRPFPDDEKRDGWLPIVSPDGRDGSLTLHQDATIYATILGPDERMEYTLADGRYAWVQALRGSARLNGIDLAEGDGAAVSDETALAFEASEGAELLLFDLA